MKKELCPYPCFFFSLSIAFLLVLLVCLTESATPKTESGNIGAIVDNSSSRMGKEAKVGMEIAIHDFNTQTTTNQSLILRLHIPIISKQSEPIQAALAARSLIKTKKVQAILGPHAWEESSLVADVCTQAHIPILSLATDSTPEWATLRWPFLIRASSSPNQRSQMKAVAAIVQSWEWHRVTLIYEDTTNSASNGVISHLSTALREVDAEIDQLIALPPFPSSSFSEELQRLKGEQCRVFVVHVSLPLAIHFFAKAKKMEMMTKDYVWITTDTITSLIYSLDASAISSMQGVIGIKAYFPETGPRFQEFTKKFKKKFSKDHPEEKNHEPGIFAVQAYDAMWAVALALGGAGKSDGQEIIEKISSTDFNGLTGKIRFNGRKLAPSHTFQIVNVIGKSYREFAFWTEGRGFSETIDQTVFYYSSMQVLGQVFWPGGPRYTPKGWTASTEIERLRIGVPTGSMFKQFVNVEYDNRTNRFSFTGFSIDVFKATIERLPYDCPYEFVPFDGPYDDLVRQVHLKNFRGVVGDVKILASRYQYAEFTEAYTESGLVMIVPVQLQTNRALLFMKPFTTDMWILIMAINMYNGFVVWLIERNHCPELQGSVMDQIGTLLWLGFTTLFSLHGEKLHSNLSRMAMVVWLFVALVITQSYTASLTSMLTVPLLQPATRNIETLKNSDAMVGHGKGTYVPTYLKDVLGFKSTNLKNFSSPQECAQALKSGEIAALFLVAPFAKLFLAMYCKSFILAGPSYKIGGFGFVFPKGSPMLADINEALLKVAESGTLGELENSMTGTECLDMESDHGNPTLSLNSFWILFILTGGTSTVALVFYVILGKWKFSHMLQHKINWRLMLAMLSKYYQLRPEHHVTMCPIGNVL
ncbi:hypothetical protein ACSBR1_011763 [Camellia fascicularis]